VISLTTLTGVRHTLSSCGSADNILENNKLYTVILVLISFLGSEKIVKPGKIVIKKDKEHHKFLNVYL